VREAIVKGDKEYVKKAMEYNAARCILQPTLQEQQNMRTDFENLGIINPALDIIESSGAWPLAKLQKRLADLKPGEAPAVIIVSGSMSPVHNGHLEVLRRGRERLEQAGYKVIAGFLSPQNATGAAAEMRSAAGSEEEQALSTGFRLKSTEIALKDDDFASLGAWEASVTGRAPQPHEVMRELANYISANVDCFKRGQNQLRTFYACGPGQAKRLGLNKSMGLTDKGIVVVPREDEDCFMLEKPSALFFVGPPALGEANIVVAAKIRAAVQAGNAAYVSTVCHPAVARFVVSPTSSEKLAFKSDFEYLRPIATNGPMRLADKTAENEAREKFKAVLNAWAGPSGVLPIEDITRLLEVLDPSWTNSELNTFSNGAFGAVSKAGGVGCDDLVDWMFKSNP
jgi:hypothetical protein